MTIEEIGVNGNEKMDREEGKEDGVNGSDGDSKNRKTGKKICSVLKWLSISLKGTLFHQAFSLQVLSTRRRYISILTYKQAQNVTRRSILLNRLDLLKRNPFHQK